MEKRPKTQKKNFLCLIFLCAFIIPSSLFGQKNSCVECHSQLDHELLAPVKAFEQDIHKQYGLSCQDCHGGNPARDEPESAKDKSFKGAPERIHIPEFCGSCHSNSNYIKAYNPSLRVDQLELYGTSEHGQLFKKGDIKVAICTDCHGKHGIQSAKYPKSLTFPWNISQTCATCHASQDYMKGYRISTNQLDDYKQSVHAHALFEKKDLSAPTCNDCHGNHGATPPEIMSIAYVCRQCHPSTGELFSKSPHKKAFDEMGISECEACHGNHKILHPTDNLLGTGKESVCIQCHEPGSAAYEISARIKKRLDDFTAKFQKCELLIARAEKQGVEASEPKFRLQDVNTELISARNLTHSLSLQEVEEKIGEGEKILAEVEKAGEDALREAKFRKSGLVIATLFLLLFAIALFLKIKEMGRKAAP